MLHHDTRSFPNWPTFPTIAVAMSLYDMCSGKAQLDTVHVSLAPFYCVMVAVHSRSSIGYAWASICTLATTTNILSQPSTSWMSQKMTWRLFMVILTGRRTGCTVAQYGHLTLKGCVLSMLLFLLAQNWAKVKLLHECVRRLYNFTIFEKSAIAPIRILSAAGVCALWFSIVYVNPRLAKYRVVSDVLSRVFFTCLLQDFVKLFFSRYVCSRYFPCCHFCYLFIAYAHFHIQTYMI